MRILFWIGTMLALWVAYMGDQQSTLLGTLGPR